MNLALFGSNGISFWVILIEKICLNVLDLELFKVILPSGWLRIPLPVAIEEEGIYLKRLNQSPIL